MPKAEFHSFLIRERNKYNANQYLVVYLAVIVLKAYFAFHGIPMLVRCPKWRQCPNMTITVDVTQQIKQTGRHV